LAVPDLEFEQVLNYPDLIEQYRDKISGAECQLKRTFWQEAEFRRNQKLHGIELEKKHRVLLNLAVFPFTEGQPGSTIDYHFIRASPLAEIDKPNFDFLIWNPSTAPATVIFGEGKGTVEDANAAVKQTLHRAQVAIDELDHVKTKYLGVAATASIRLEFVIVCPSTEATEVLLAAQSHERKLVVWHAPLAGQPMLKLASPPDFPDRHLMMHGDKRLNDLLASVPSSWSCFDLWPKMHPALSLSATYKVVERSDRDLYVTESIIESIVDADMFYLMEQEKADQVSRILNLARQIGFITPIAGEARFRVAATKEKRSATENRAYSLWIEHSLREDLTTLIDANRTAIQGEFRKFRERRPTLDEAW